MTAKTICIVAIRQRPASCERSSRSTSSPDVAENRSAVRVEVPSVLARRTPLTDSPSSIWWLRSARWRCWAAVTARRSSATLRVSHRAGGMTSSESSDRRHDSATIATAVATAVVRFAAIDVAVDVTTPCMPLTSLVRRDCTSPARVRVKKPSDWRCRWVKTAVRSSCMTRWPTWVDSHVCTTPSSWVTAATATMRAGPRARAAARPAAAARRRRPRARGTAGPATRRSSPR